ncbi:MAG TPA: sigma-70 family RNA polymerase sigma factor [Candidatus Dormibacteraeota bacterium]|nr:sigma-70 family RNA polymerase sigma factor [Candidatus Dormibacteraeota bacterium]
MDRPAVEVALEEMEGIYSFLFARVGNRPDAEDLTQQVALKALPRLHQSASQPAIRSYLYATARSALGAFWSNRLRLPEAELADELPDRLERESPEPSVEVSAWLEQTLSALPVHYREVLELRFLRGASIREVAQQTHRTPGAVKVMQLRALRAAAALPVMPTRSRPARPRPAIAPGSAFALRPASQAVAAPQR